MSHNGLFQLLQWRAAVKLERVGMRHSSGRSCRKHAAIALGLSAKANHNDVLEAIREEICAITGVTSE